MEYTLNPCPIFRDQLSYQHQLDYAEAYSNRGNALKELEQLGEAVASYDKAIGIKSDHADAYYNRGIALKELNQLNEAVASYDEAISIKADYAEAYSNRGNALQGLKQLDEAVASYDKAISIKPDYAEAYWNKSLALLLCGKFGNGWELYKWRWRCTEIHPLPRDFTQPLWEGGSLDGKTVLV